MKYVWESDHLMNEFTVEYSHVIRAPTLIQKCIRLLSAGLYQLSRIPNNDTPLILILCDAYDRAHNKKIRDFMKVDFVCFLKAVCSYDWKAVIEQENRGDFDYLSNDERIACTDFCRAVLLQTLKEKNEKLPENKKAPNGLWRWVRKKSQQIEESKNVCGTSVSP